MAEMTMIEALNLALHQEMEADESVLVRGEDVGVDGGIFRLTEGLIEAFGEHRVIDTPLAESAIVGMAIGLAVYGLKPVTEMQFSGFSYMAFHQLESHAARLRWRSQGRHAVPMVVRMPYGAGVRALEHHSESREAYFAHTPGLKMVIPSGPWNARALLLAAIRDPDPVVFFEPKALYRSHREEVPDDPETMPLGEARAVREGGDITLVAYGAMLSRTLAAADRLAEAGRWLEDKVMGTDVFVQPWMIDVADDDYTLDTSRAQELLGWRPQHSLRERLPVMIERLKKDPVGWYAANGLDRERAAT